MASTEASTEEDVVDTVVVIERMAVSVSFHKFQQLLGWSSCLRLPTYRHADSDLPSCFTGLQVALLVDCLVT